MFKKFLTGLAVALMCCAGREALAATITIQALPDPPPVVGQHAFVLLEMSGLGDPGFPSLGAFDLDLFYDGAILRPQRATFLGALGDPDVVSYGFDIPSGSFVGDVFGSSEALTSASQVGPGATRVMNLSLLEDSLATCVFCAGPYLEDLQSSPFLMMALIFDTLDVGISPLSLRINGLADGNGNPISASIGGDDFIQVVPEPSTLLLMVGGAPWLMRQARRRRRQS